MTGPRICDRSEEPFLDTILLSLRTIEILSPLSFDTNENNGENEDHFGTR